MKKNNQAVFYTAAITALSIIIFQAYWAYNAYLSARNNLYEKTLQALEKSIDAYQVNAMNTLLPRSLGDSVPYLSVLQVMQSGTGHPVALDPRSVAGHKAPYQLQFTPYNIAPQYVSEARRLIARAAATLSPRPVTLPAIDSLFKQQLARQGITLHFALALLPAGTPAAKGDIATAITSGAASYVVTAHASNTWQYVLRESSAPIGISFILILLTAGSLWFMGSIIRSQEKIARLKTEFVNNITHELRTPIAILKSANEALYQFGESDNPEKTRRYLKISAGILNNLDKNVDRLLDVARYEDGRMPVKLVEVRPADIINSVIESLPPHAAQTLTFHSGLGTATVLTDPHIIETAAFNLIDNARKYSGDGATIQVALLRSATENSWQLVVSDNGPGIDAAHLPLIFDKFFRVPTGDLHEIKGYGIGLSHVKQLIALLQGNITVKSKPGKGTTFTINIPFRHE